MIDRRSDRGALEPLLQVLHVDRELLLRLPPHNQRDEDLADAVTLEVELERYSRSSPVVERLDRALDVPSDRAVNTSNAPTLRRIAARRIESMRTHVRIGVEGHVRRATKATLGRAGRWCRRSHFPRGRDWVAGSAIQPRSPAFSAALIGAHLVGQAVLGRFPTPRFGRS